MIPPWSLEFPRKVRSTEAKLGLDIRPWDWMKLTSEKWLWGRFLRYCRFRCRAGELQVTWPRTVSAALCTGCGIQGPVVRRVVGGR